ncbi:MAG: SDR family oxidoreductase [Pseudomonadales bacterium]|nr:SDR family oxidoreductase [Pseudomonadales bacterium]
MGLLQNKTVLVTGAASGIGQATAIKLGAEGAQLVITDIDENGLANTLSQLKEIDAEAIAISFDVRNESKWQQVIAETLRSYKKLDGLVNCAGIVESKPIKESSLEDFQHTLSVNLEGSFLGLKYAHSTMKSNPEGGAIINISSVVGQLGLPGYTSYSASKGGMRLMTKAAAIEFGIANTNIRANSVHPGSVDSPLLSNHLTSDQLSELKESVPLKRLAHTEDIANTIAFLLSDGAKFMTGSEVTVDGGMSCRLALSMKEEHAQ